ncbi:hypothetical protein T440DRAFT_130423 [Plenodomus tracheiphilus IPT5]|uniref:Uncharacterized protein n=1 Tax=Plenodomus tracheiphilus IPT5 TaxID=1408161 RepID=A0A6A7B326_9PLEO|nr:hypothetical protein T440DRAFT_130423 [Plenodomus tracheiphilus IPT5]
MTTPSPRPSDLTLGNPGPSSSFLKQLLNEINGEENPAPARRDPSQRTTPAFRPRSHGSRKRRSSVWVGGATIAQDARDKLRVADEARLRRASLQGTDGTPALGPTPRLIRPRSPASSSSSGSSMMDVRSSDSSLKKLGKTSAPRSLLRGSSSNAASPRQRPNLSGLRMPPAQFLVPPSTSAERANSPRSPLIFCDIDSDISLTPSDTEPPTSAATDDSTQASTWSASNPSNRGSYKSISPGKRDCETFGQPRMPAKKLRNSTLPETQSTTLESRTSRKLGDDNRRLIRNAEFIERAAALPESISAEELVILPELSSFRPDATPTTPVRPGSRRASMAEKSPCPSPETPSWARSLHLIDTDVSIYKGQANPWRDNSLCLYCFSRHGKFSKVLPLGYEVCGSDAVLESHYWEPTA